MKTKKRKLEDKLDAEVRRVVRVLYPVCARCGKGPVQVCHIFSRNHKSVRWFLDNIIGLDWNCHFFWAHQEPTEFTEMIKKRLGIKRYNALRKKASETKCWTITELEELLEALKKIQ